MVDFTQGGKVVELTLADDESGWMSLSKNGEEPTETKGSEAADNLSDEATKEELRRQADEMAFGTDELTDAEVWDAYEWSHWKGEDS